MSSATSGPNRVVWEYDVAAGPADLVVDARFAPGSSDELRGDDDAAAFFADVAYWAGQSFKPARREGRAWIVPCLAHGCRVRYRFALRQAAASLDDALTAIASGDVIVAPPSTWLLHPEDAPGRFRFHVAAAGAGRFTTGVHCAADGSPDTFEGSTQDLDRSSFAVFGPFHLETAQSGTSRIALAIAPYALPVSDVEALLWVDRAVESISNYAGVRRFPVDRTLVIVQKGRTGSPTRGVTLGGGGPAVLIRLGDGTDAVTLREDWVLTHELLHVVLPSLPREQDWLSEGLASYLEPIIRVRAGSLTPEKLWGDLVDGLPQGLPQSGDEGLARTHTWGRTYWGGALFCLMADVTIRDRTENARGLDDVIRAVVATGADLETPWDVVQFLEAGDRATNMTVLHDLYRSLALAPGTVDLPALWSHLGVRGGSGHLPVIFDDSAPLAAVRRAIGGR